LENYFVSVCNVIAVNVCGLRYLLKKELARVKLMWYVLNIKERKYYVSVKLVYFTNILYVKRTCEEAVPIFPGARLC
jgi:hypothetical protein